MDGFEKVGFFVLNRVCSGHWIVVRRSRSAALFCAKHGAMSGCQNGMLHFQGGARAILQGGRITRMSCNFSLWQ